MYYLHTQDPPLYGDLNPHNILINTNPSLQAKISHAVAIRDQEYMLGAVSRVHASRSSNWSTNLWSKVSFGVVLLGVTGEWPTPMATIKFDFKTGNPVVLSEVNQCQQYFEKMRGEVELLKSLVKECLGNDPAIRPGIGDVSKTVEILQKKLKVGSYPDNNVVSSCQSHTCFQSRL